MSTAKITVNSFQPKWQTLITLKTTNTVDEALETLRDRHFRSAPVFDAQGKPVGFVDVLDLVAALVKSYSKSPSKHETAVQALRHDNVREEYGSYAQEQQFRTKKLGDTGVLNASKRNPWVTLPNDAPLVKALGHFASGVHHLALVDHEGHVTGVLAQADIVRFMNENTGAKLGATGLKTVSELGCIKKLHLVGIRTKALDAFTAMNDAGVSYLPVVDDQGKLVGNLSAADITQAPSLHHTDLVWPVSHFIARLRELVYKYKPVVAIDEHTTLAAALGEFTRNKVHHLWIVDKNDQPVGVISLTDVLALFLKTLGEEQSVEVIAPSDLELAQKQADEKKRHDEAEAARIQLLLRRREERKKEEEEFAAKYATMSAESRQHLEAKRQANAREEEFRLTVLRQREEDRKNLEALRNEKTAYEQAAATAARSPAPPKQAELSESDRRRLDLIQQRLQERLKKEHEEDEKARHELELSHSGKHLVAKP